jgi:hypothetical protein
MLCQENFSIRHFYFIYIDIFRKMFDESKKELFVMNFVFEVTWFNIS